MGLGTLFDGGSWAAVDLLITGIVFDVGDPVLETYDDEQTRVVYRPDGNGTSFVPHEQSMLSSPYAKGRGARLMSNKCNKNKKTKKHTNECLNECKFRACKLCQVDCKILSCEISARSFAPTKWLDPTLVLFDGCKSKVLPRVLLGLNSALLVTIFGL